MLKNMYTHKLFKNVLLQKCSFKFPINFGHYGKTCSETVILILTLAYHSQTHLNLLAFVIANTFPVISTSQSSVTVSIIKQWVFSLVFLKKISHID